MGLGEFSFSYELQVYFYVNKNDLINIIGNMLMKRGKNWWCRGVKGTTEEVKPWIVKTGFIIYLEEICHK